MPSVRFKLFGAALLTVVAIACATAITAVFEQPSSDHDSSFPRPSIAVFQFTYLIGLGGLLGMTLGHTTWRGLRTIGVLTVVAIFVYCGSLVLIGEFAKGGEFGLGAVAFTALFGLLPSTAFLFFVVPAALLYAMLRSSD